MKPLYQFLGGMVFSIVATAAALNAYHAHDRLQIGLSIPGQTAVVKKDIIDRMQLDCMAQNIFFEARGESARGKAWVGMVVMERTQSPHFPHTICEVVQQPGTDIYGNPIYNRCKFSWVCDGRDHNIDFANPMVQKEWNESYMIAKLVMLGKIKEPIDMGGVTFYHNGKVNPAWARDKKNFQLVARIGEHLFYRWKKAKAPIWEPTANVAMN